MKIIPIGGVLCAVAVVFSSAYTQTADGVGLVILLVFFTYFLNLKSGARGGALSPASGAVINSPIRELAKGLACLVLAAVVVAVGLKIPDVRLAVAVALTAAVAAIVGFMLFLMRAFSAWQSGKFGG